MTYLFLILLEVQGHTVSHLKALRYIYDLRWLSCGSTFIICQAFLKCANLPHKQICVDSQMVATHPIINVFDILALQNFTIHCIVVDGQSTSNLIITKIRQFRSLIISAVHRVCTPFSFLFIL